MIKIRNIEFSYGKKRIFKDFSLDIDEGEFFGIIGPNGSGKSTLIKILLGIFKIRNGKVEINSKNIEKISKLNAAKQTSAVMQEFSPAFDFKVKDIIKMGRTPHMKLFGELKREDHEIIDKAIEDTDLRGYEDRSFRTLSGGEKQRVLIAKCFAQNTPVILLDEFVAHLDLGHVQNLMKKVFNKNRNEGNTVVGVFHDINTASMFCDRIAIIKEGCIFKIGSPLEIINEGVIRDAYNASCSVFMHPVNGNPQIMLDR